MVNLAKKSAMMLITAVAAKVTGSQLYSLFFSLIPSRILETTYRMHSVVLRALLTQSLEDITASDEG